MLALLNRYATPLVTGFFLVSAVSGVALFFRWLPAAFHSMHVWLSLVLLVPFMLHLMRNWRPMKAYLRRKTLLIPLILSILVAVPFAVSGLSHQGGGSPISRTLALLTQAPLTDLAPLLKTDPEQLRNRLQAQGYAVGSVNQNLDAIGRKAGQPARALLFRMMSAAP